MANFDLGRVIIQQLPAKILANFCSHVRLQGLSLKHSGYKLTDEAKRGMPWALQDNDAEQGREGSE